MILFYSRIGKFVCSLKHIKFRKSIFKTKNILIIAIVLVVIGIGFYAFLVYQGVYFPSEVAKTETPEPILAETKKLQGMEYEIVSVGTWQDEIKWARYHVVIGELLMDEGQVKILAERIIKDIMAEDSELDKVELLFYHDKNIACQTEQADAQAIWTPDELSVKILEKNSLIFAPAEFPLTPHSSLRSPRFAHRSGLGTAVLP